jgi:hypothetical protein
MIEMQWSEGKGKIFGSEPERNLHFPRCYPNPGCWGISCKLDKAITPELTSSLNPALSRG